jgi:glycosyltransferase involved in cell wall biosynthesis
MNRARLALVSNFRAEASPSMLVCGDRLHEALVNEHPEFETVRIQPEYVRIATRLPSLPLLRRLSGGADKMLNRYVVYPRHLAKLSAGFDLFHICDHSYASLMHGLPAERTGVLCHDVDVFRSVLQPELYRRSPRFNAMQRHALAGLAKAAIVFHTTDHVREEILRYGLTRRERLVQVPLGVNPRFLPPATPGERSALLRETVGERPFLLNVSVTLARKRLDVLLRTYALLRRSHPDLLLLRIGPDWSGDQQALITELGIAEGIRRIPRLEQDTLASFYGAAAAVLMTSEAEGFGMPLIEALACGTVAVVSDIPVFHEVAGPAAVYCPVGDAAAWARRLTEILNDPGTAPPVAVRRDQVRRYTWSAHAAVIAAAYRERILERLGPRPAAGGSR